MIDGNNWLHDLVITKHTHFQKLHEQMIMVTVWWFAIGVVHYNFPVSNQNIMAEVYYQQLDKIYVQ